MIQIDLVQYRTDIVAGRVPARVDQIVVAEPYEHPAQHHALVQLPDEIGPATFLIGRKGLGGEVVGCQCVRKDVRKYRGGLERGMQTPS